jgi:hypothetical protein
MVHMHPIANCFKAYRVITNVGHEIVPVNDCAALDLAHPDALCLLAPYCYGGSVYSATQECGWYARLSAPGYLDCTPWEGPFTTEALALVSICNTYDVDLHGNAIAESV